MNASAARDTNSGKVLVVGLGNPDCADDGIGILVVRQLTGRLPDDVTLLARSGDLVSLIDEWSGFDAVVCIDASAPMGSPGRIHRIDLATEELPQDLAPTSSHAFGLADVVRLARTLARAPRDMVAFAVEGGCFERGAVMSAAVTAAVSDVTDRVMGEVGRLRGY